MSARGIQFRNGYEDKLFRVDSVVDSGQSRQLFSTVTEIDPADYDWDPCHRLYRRCHRADRVPRPAPQGVMDWYAEPYTLIDTDGQPAGRRSG